MMVKAFIYFVLISLSLFFLQIVESKKGMNSDGQILGTQHRDPNDPDGNYHRVCD